MSGSTTFCFVLFEILIKLCLFRSSMDKKQQWHKSTSWYSSTQTHEGLHAVICSSESCFTGKFANDSRHLIFYFLFFFYLTVHIAKMPCLLTHFHSTGLIEIIRTQYTNVKAIGFSLHLLFVLIVFFFFFFFSSTRIWGLSASPDALISYFQIFLR